MAGMLLVGCGDADPARPSPVARELLDKAEGLAHTFQAETPVAALPWSWEGGVLMLGMLELERATGERRWGDYALAWLEHHRERGFGVVWSDSCPPGTVASLLMERRDAAELQPIVDAIDSYLFDRAPRTSDGGLSHLGIVFPELSQLWVDSLFMFGEYLIQNGLRTGDTRRLALAVEQFEIFGRRLQDPASGLYTHSWDDRNRRPAPPLEDEIFWARGNGWALVSGFDLAAALPPSDPRREDVLARVARQEASLLRLQDENGLYWTVLTRPGEIYQETAASGLITYGLARGLAEGLAAPMATDAVRRGLDGLSSRLRVEPDGRHVLGGTSLGTIPGSFEYYAGVPTADNVPYGVGALLLAVSEAVRLERVGGIRLDASSTR